MKRLHVGFFLSFLVMGMIASAQTTVHNFSFGGVTRSYRLYVPGNYTGATAVPLVFNLHGYTSNALQQEFYSGMNAVADTAGFIVCYPDGINASWNSGFQTPYYGGVDDVGFISVLIDSIQAGYNIAPERVYSCGMSNGGFMSYRLACDLETRIAAIASVTGSMTPLQVNNCTASRAVPVLELHGTADATVPYNGQVGMLSIDSVLNFWRNVNACPATTYDTLPDLVLEGSTVTSQWNAGCTDGTEVGHFKIANGGHTWPGAFFQITGLNTNQDIDASIEIWKFFYRFSHPNPVLTGAVAPSASLIPQVCASPSQQTITIRNIEAGAQIQLINEMGQTTGTWIASGNSMAIETSAFPTGIYFVRILQADMPHTTKVMLHH